MRMGFWTLDSDEKTPADTVNHSYTISEVYSNKILPANFKKKHEKRSYLLVGFWTWDSDGKTPADTVNHSYTISEVYSNKILLANF